MVDDQIGLRASVIDGGDDDYLGIEIYSSANRFAGTTRIYAGLNELSEFAARSRDSLDGPATRCITRLELRTASLRVDSASCDSNAEIAPDTSSSRSISRMTIGRTTRGFPSRRRRRALTVLLASYAQLIDRVLARPSSLECGNGRTKVLRNRDSCEQRTSAFAEATADKGG